MGLIDTKGVSRVVSLIARDCVERRMHLELSVGPGTKDRAISECARKHMNRTGNAIQSIKSESVFDYLLAAGL